MNIIKQLIDWIDVRVGTRQIVEHELTGYLLPRNINVWYSLGSILLFCFSLQVVTGISLTGYLLPWSQLSFWATTVATNSAGAIPVVGSFLVEFLRGGKLVGPPT